jgi:hypothetical protein
MDGHWVELSPLSQKNATLCAKSANGLYTRFLVSNTCACEVDTTAQLHDIPTAAWRFRTTEKRGGEPFGPTGALPVSCPDAFDGSLYD